MVQKFHAQRKWKEAAAMDVICKKDNRNTFIP